MKPLALLILIPLLFSFCKKSNVSTGVVTIIDETVPLVVADTATKIVVILGSSTAYGNGATCSDSNWVNRLKKQSIIDKHRLNFINLSVPGYCTFEAMPNGFSLSGRTLPDTKKNVTMAIEDHPDLVLINFPTNDIAHDYTDTEILNNYAIMTGLLKAAKVPYILFGTQPRDFADSKQRLRLKTLNDKLKGVYGLNYDDYLDELSTATYMIRSEYNSGDGVHLNNKGHKLIFEAVSKHQTFKTL